MVTSVKHIEFAICVANDGRDDLEVSKVYQVLCDAEAAGVGCRAGGSHIFIDYFFTILASISSHTFGSSSTSAGSCSAANSKCCCLRSNCTFSTFAAALPVTVIPTSKGNRYGSPGSVCVKSSCTFFAVAS